MNAFISSAILRAALAEIFEIPADQVAPVAADMTNYRRPALTARPAHRQRLPAVMPVAVADDAPVSPPPTLRSMLDELAASDPARLPWPDDWITRRDPGDADACRRMWGACLISCLHSVLKEAMAEFARGPKKPRLQRNEGRPVLNGWIGSRDFHMVCALSGLDGVAVEEGVKAALQTNAACEAMFAALHSGHGRVSSKA